MVEGQLDAIRCTTAGLQTTIAPQGTGVTDTQLRLLHRYDAGLECLLDGDSAGQKAALRLLPLALKEGLEVRFLPLAALGAKIDPDELVRDRGAEAIHELRRHPVSAMAFATGALAPDPQALSAQQTADICRELFAIIRETPSEVAQSGYLAEVAKLLHINRTALEADYRRFRENAERRASFRAQAASPAPSPTPTPTPAPPPRDSDEPLPEAPEGHPGLEPDSVAGVVLPTESAAPKSTQPDTASPPTAFPSVEQDMLLILVHFDSLGKALAQHVHHEWIDTSSRAGRLLDRFLNDFSHDLWPGVQEVESVLEDPEDRNFVASLLFDPPSIEDPIKVANDGIRRMVSNFCDPRLRKIELEIAAKQGKFDADLILLLKTTEELRRLKLHPPLISHPV
jgi:DNA primase